MKLVEILAGLRKTGQPVWRTADVMARFGLDKAHASQLMGRLAQSAHLVRIKRGLWVFPEELEPMVLGEYLTAPFPSYVSLQSALYHHGMISQVSAVVYCVSAARTRVYRTALGTYSIHHVEPSFFFGFESAGSVKLATAEKALVDFLYLAPARSRLFGYLPELELPEGFSFRRAEQIIQRIGSAGRRTLVVKKLQRLMQTSKEI